MRKGTGRQEEIHILFWIFVLNFYPESVLNFLVRSPCLSAPVCDRMSLGKQEKFSYFYKNIKRKEMQNNDAIENI